MKKTALFFIAILFLAFAFPAQVKAEEYTVQPILLIPKDWKSRVTPELENQYKQNILDSLSEVQSWYKTKLNGKAFKFPNRVDVRQVDGEIGDPTYFSKINDADNRKDIWSVFLRLGGRDFLFYPDDTLHAFWLVGSGGGGNWGGYISRNGDTTRKVFFALLTHENLINLDKKRDPWIRNKELGIVAHELGHGFNLVFAGKAKGHPCSEASTNECLGEPPFPPADEWSENVMGPQWLYPNTGFTNTIANPVVEKAYKSLFLNPQRDPAPAPTLKLKKTVVNSVRPKNLRPGESFEIIGNGFGQNKGNLSFKSFLLSVPEFRDFEILSWSDDIITAKIKDSTEKVPYLRTYITAVITSDGKNSYAGGDNVLSIAAQEKIPQATTIKVNATCGNNSQPFIAGYEVSFYRDTPDLQNVLISKAHSDSEGKTTLVLTNPTVGFYKIIMTRLDGQLPNPSPALFSIGIMKNQSTPTEVIQNFNIPECPGLTPTLTITPTVTPTLEAIESHDICKKYDGDIDACDAAKCVYFLCTNQCYPDGVSEKVVCADKGEQPCENKYNWDPNANDEAGACIHKFPSDESNAPPDCNYIFDPVPVDDESLCPDKPSTPTPPASEETINKIVSGIEISNYDDFRDTNIPSDQGSITLSFSPPEGQQEQSVDWTLSTTQGNVMHVRKLFSDNTYEDSEISLDNGQSIQIEFVQIKAKVLKKVTEVLINGQSVDINNPKLSLHLEGTEGQDQDFTVPVLVRYSNGDEESADLQINYRPEHASSSTSETTPAQSEQSTTAPGQSETIPVPAGQQETTPAQTQQPTPPDETPAPAQTCDDVYYWDENANDGEGACIYKHTDNPWPDCEPYAFDPTNNGDCGR